MRIIRDRDEKVRKAEENLANEKAKASSNVKEITDLKRQLGDVRANTQKHSGELLAAKTKEEVLQEQINKLTSRHSNESETQKRKSVQLSE